MVEAGRQRDPELAPEPSDLRRDPVRGASNHPRGLPTTGSVDRAGVASDINADEWVAR